MKEYVLYFKYVEIYLTCTIDSQLEVLPRISVLYNQQKGIAFEWLWFSIYLELCTENF